MSASAMTAIPDIKCRPQTLADLLGSHLQVDPVVTSPACSCWLTFPLSLLDILLILAIHFALRADLVCAQGNEKKQSCASAVPCSASPNSKMLAFYVCQIRAKTLSVDSSLLAKPMEY